MATYDVSTVASQIQPPQATSLSDMLNVARGAQAYQQAQQVNPLIAQQQQTATEQAQFNLQQVKADKVKGLANSLLASQNWSDPSKMGHEFEFVERVAKSQGLDVTSPNNPLELIKKEYKDQGPEAAYQKLYQMTYGAQPQGTQFEAASKGVVAPPLPGKQQPTTSTTTGIEEYSKPEKLSYQPPIPGQVRPQQPSEEGDRQFGEKVRTELTNAQRNYGSVRQNYDKLIDQAEMLAGNTFFGGAAGTAERTLKAKIGTPEYQQLSKDLANAQISQIKAEGGSLDTVSGQSLLAHANGSVIYDPKVLIDIARRNAANVENKNMQATGMRNFTDRFGDANMKHFISMWNKNANDNSVFEMKYIFDKNGGGEKGTKAIQEYIKSSGLSAEKRKELATKYLNLQKLETTGTL